MRIAIDTNVLVAALTRPRGQASRIVRAWLEGQLEVVASNATIAEAESVLGAGWLARVTSGQAVDGLLEELRMRTVRVPGKPLSDLWLKDAGDRRLVEAAVEGGARYLVTTDREVLRCRGYADVEFLPPAEFLDRVVISSQQDE